MHNTLLHRLEWDSDSFQEVWTCKVKTCTFLAFVDLLDDAFYLRMAWDGRVNEVVARFLGFPLFLSKVEGFVVLLDKILEAGVINLVVKIEVDTSLVIEVEQSQDIGPLNHDHAVQSDLTEMQ